MIPKIIHQIWLQGEASIPAELRILYDNCKKINSDFEHIFWDEHRIRELLNNSFGPEYVALYDFYEIFAQKADFARYAILYVHGGIYLDMDTMCKKNLSSFLKHDFFTTISGDGFYEFYKRYHNAVIGTKAKHPFFIILFKNIFDRKEYANNVTYSTGTRLFYDSMQQYIESVSANASANKSTTNSDPESFSSNNHKHESDNGITIIDPKYLHPCGIFNGPDCAETCNECYIVHTNHSSWSPTSKLIKYITSNVRTVLMVLVIIIVLLIIYFKFMKK